MSKNKYAFAILGFVLAGVVGATPALAKKKHNDECEKGFDLVRVNQALCRQAAKQVDKYGNDDNYVCEKSKKGLLKYSDNEEDHEDY